MPGKHKKSTYKMKYQGNSSAFPFKNSPMRNGKGFIKTALMTGDPVWTNYSSAGIKPTGKVNVGGIEDIKGLVKQTPTGTEKYSQIKTKVGTDVYKKIIKTTSHDKKSTAVRIERMTNMQTGEKGRFLQQVGTGSAKVKKSLNIAKIISKGRSWLDPIGLAYTAAKFHQKGTHSKFPKATGEGSYKERETGWMKKGVSALNKKIMKKKK
jgi:hypothetical protein